MAPVGPDVGEDNSTVIRPDAEDRKVSDRRPNWDIPPAGRDVSEEKLVDGQTMVDCGADGFVSRPKKGVVYNFPRSNKNFNCVAFAHGKATSHTKNETVGQCQGIITCQHCRFKIRPKTTPAGIQKQLKTLDCFNCKTKSLSHTPCGHMSYRSKHPGRSYTLEGKRRTHRS